MQKDLYTAKQYQNVPFKPRQSLAINAFLLKALRLNVMAPLKQAWSICLLACGNTRGERWWLFLAVLGFVRID
jgi:hypothetical protein